MLDLSQLQMFAAALIVGVIGFSLWRVPKTVLGWTWLAFCASVTASLLLRALGGEIGPVLSIILAPASATCGVAWLLARALFRAGQPFHRGHIAVVAVIAAVNLSPAGALGAMLGNLQGLLSSTVIVLTLWEAIRGWQALTSRAERVMRAIFAAMTGLAVLVATIWASRPGVPAGVSDAIETTALLALVGTAALCVRFRQRHGLDLNAASTRKADTDRTRSPDPEIRQLGGRLDGLVRAEALYLDGELKVADLARKLQVPDYKITRAITGALGAANFNQYINQFRIEHARALIAKDPAKPILIVAFDSGFASLGPFNRAFKAITGQTPRSYRAGLEPVEISALS